VLAKEFPAAFNFHNYPYYAWPTPAYPTDKVLAIYGWQE